MVVLSFAVDTVSRTPNNAVASVIWICIPVLAFISLSTISHTGVIFRHGGESVLCSLFHLSSMRCACSNWRVSTQS